MWNAKILPCVGALPYCALTSPGVSVWQLEWSGKSLCVGPIERGLCFSILVLPLLPFPALVLSFLFFLCQLSGSSALLVGSDLRTGYSEMWWERKTSFPGILWQKPCLLRDYVASKHLENLVGALSLPPHSGMCTEACWSPLFTQIDFINILIM